MKKLAVGFVSFFLVAGVFANNCDEDIYRTIDAEAISEDGYNIKIVGNLFCTEEYPDSPDSAFGALKTSPPGRAKYSDFGYRYNCNLVEVPARYGNATAKQIYKALNNAAAFSENNPGLNVFSFSKTAGNLICIKEEVLNWSKAPYWSEASYKYEYSCRMQKNGVCP